MGWDYHTYEAQPPHFIEEILIFMQQENQRDKIDSQNMESKSRMKSGGYSRNG